MRRSTEHFAAIDRHLSEALEATDHAEKDYHVRSALQFLTIQRPDATEG